MQVLANASPSHDNNSAGALFILPGALFSCFVQPHGILIVLDAQGVVTHQSRGATELLPGLGLPGQELPYDLWCTDSKLRNAVHQVLDGTAGGEGELPFAIELTLPGGTFDVLIHSFDERVLVEFERRADTGGDAAPFASLAHSSVNRLKQLRSVDALLGEAVVTLRKLRMV